MDRRSFLRGAASTLFAPAVIGSGVLMPVKKVIEPSREIITVLSPEAYQVAVFKWNKEIVHKWIMHRNGLESAAEPQPLKVI